MTPCRIGQILKIQEQRVYHVVYYGTLSAEQRDGHWYVRVEDALRWAWHDH